MCVCDLAHTTGILLDFNQIRVLRQSLLLLGCRQLDVQDAILELCVDILFLYGIAHIEAARAGAGEGFAPQIAAILILFVVAVAAHCLNGQVVRSHSNDEKDKKGRYLRRESFSGTCARSFYVGDVKKEDIHAKFEDGVLHIELPAPQQTKALPENPNLIEIE